MAKLSTILRKLGACGEARKWAEPYATLEEAWKVCTRPDWILWLLDKTELDKNDPRFRLMACDFAESVLHLVPAGEDRPRRAIEVARRFASGDADREEMAAAKDAAWAAARDEAWDAQANIIRTYFPTCPPING